MKDHAFNLLIKSIGLLAGFGLSFFGPIKNFLILVLCLVFADLITGVKAAQRRKEVIHSKGLRRSISKVVWYFFAIILTRGVEWVFFEDTWVHEHVTITYMVSGFISSVEFQSNIENIGQLTGIDIWSRIKDKLSELLKSKHP
jgi:phage-related holin